MSMTCEIVNGLNILICMIYIRIYNTASDHGFCLDFLYMFSQHRWYSCQQDIQSCKSSRQTCIFDNGQYIWFHTKNCNHLSSEKNISCFHHVTELKEFLLDHVMYIMLYGIPCKTLHRKRENCVCTQYRMCLIKG